MKMSNDDFEELKSLVNKHYSPEAMEKAIKAHDKLGHTMKRARWDTLWWCFNQEGQAVKTATFDRWYKYMNDDHIDTALRTITSTN